MHHKRKRQAAAIKLLRRRYRDRFFVFYANLLLFNIFMRHLYSRKYIATIVRSSSLFNTTAYTHVLLFFIAE